MQFYILFNIGRLCHIAFTQYAYDPSDQINMLKLGKAHNGIGRISGMQSIRLVFLDVGYNTPGIIKYPFWQMTYENPNALYVCINQGQALGPKEIAERAIYVDRDINEAIAGLL